jgi:hypothetical protein
LLTRREPLQRRSWRVFHAIADWFTLPEAHAHPGHYQPGNALGQMVQPSSFSLFDGPADYPDGEGVSGTYRSATFALASTIEGPDKAALGTHVVVAEGTASKDGESDVRFVATADLDEVEASASQGQVSGCVFDETNVETDGTVTVTLDPRIWFRLVDFSQAQTDDDGNSIFAKDSQPQIAFAQVVAQLSAYEFSFSPND